MMGPRAGKRRIGTWGLLLAVGLAGATAGCDAGIRCPGESEARARPAGWTVPSHCDGVAPDYDGVFGTDTVRVVEIAISAADHEATWNDLDDICGGGSLIPDLDALPTPMWVNATVRTDGLSWTHVGMRYKGHSSLKAAWQSGVRKLSFILDFDHFEDRYPATKNQRFYGFGRVSFSNAYNDPSLMREKMAAEVYRAAGVPAARSAFAAVWLDWGDDRRFLGLYTLVEDPCDSMVDSQLGGGGGTLYKPWGEPARWLAVDAVGADGIAAHFDPCDPDDPRDDTALLAALDALHADRSDAAAWRADLEAVFDPGTFLRTLAVSRAMMNWDSYGCMHHNYFVYEDPLDGDRLRWFPWDLNEAMLARTTAGCPDPGSVMLDEIVDGDADGEIDTDWPLIRYLLADPVYRARYREDLRDVLDGAFAAAPVIARMRTLHDLLAPWVTGPDATEAWPYTNTSSEAFEASLTTGDNALEPHVAARHEAVEAALAE